MNIPASARRPDVRGVYVDYLGRWAWYVDSSGQKSELRTIRADERREDVELELWGELDAADPIPSSEFVRLTPRRSLRLI